MLMAAMRSGLFLAMMLAASSLAAAETPLTIDQLLAQGWEIAGYASGYDNRTSLILFRHPGVNALVQCGILYDVTRAQRTVVNCYELRQGRWMLFPGKGRLARRAVEGAVVSRFGGAVGAPAIRVTGFTAVAPKGATHAPHEIRCCRGLQSTNAHSR